MGTTKRERQKANRQQRLEELAKTARRNKSRRVAVTVAIVVVGGLVLLFGLAYLFGNDDDDEVVTTVPPATVPPVTTIDPASATTADPNATTTTEGPTTTVAVAFAYGTAPCPAADGSTEMPESFAGAPQKCIDEAKGYLAEVVTNRGAFTITLDAQKSPGNVNNIVALARYGYYDGASCHRIIKDFVVQCGRNEARGDPGYTVSDELPGPGEYEEGVVAVANTGQPNTGSGQWFVITGDNGAGLPPQYTVIGRVTKGYSSTVTALENLADPLTENGEPPLLPVTVESVTITELDEPPATTTVPDTEAPDTTDAGATDDTLDTDATDAPDDTDAPTTT